MGTTTKMAGFGFPIQLLLLLSAEHRGQSHGPLSGTSRGLSLILSILSAVPKIKYSQQYRWWVLGISLPPLLLFHRPSQTVAWSNKYTKNLNWFRLFTCRGFYLDRYLSPIVQIAVGFFPY